MSKYEPTYLSLPCWSLMNVYLRLMHEEGERKGTNLYTIPLFCYLLQDVVDAVRLAFEMQQREHYCHVSCVHMGAGFG